MPCRHPRWIGQAWLCVNSEVDLREIFLIVGDDGLLLQLLGFLGLAFVSQFYRATAGCSHNLFRALNLLEEPTVFVVDDQTPVFVTLEQLVPTHRVRRDPLFVCSITLGRPRLVD